MHIPNTGQLSLLPELRVYGPRECGRYENGEDPKFVIRLRPDTDPHALAVAIRATIWGLSVAAHQSGDASNRVALAELALTCEPDRDRHGYSTSGHLHHAFLKWLDAFGRESADARKALIRDVVAAMQSAWRVMAPEDQREYVTDCSLRILPDGRFEFRCFGNAADMSIYPDNVGSIEKLSEHVFLSFDCHNVDWPWQQITFVAGFAALFEHVRRHVDEP